MTKTLVPAAPSVRDLVRTPTDMASDWQLSSWVVLYWREEVDGGPATTQQAKHRDIQLFLDYFGMTLRSDDLDQWTRSVSRGFLAWLENDARDGKGYAPTSVNRTLATIRHFARFILDRGGFRFGTPMRGMTELAVDDPDWSGLTDLQVTRLRVALDQQLRLSTRKNQLPLRNRAITLVLFGTAIRVSGLLRLDLAQYDGRHFTNVKRKGKNRTKKLYVPSEAREALDEYISHERLRCDGPLFTSRAGKRLGRQHVDRMLKRVAALANAKLPAEEHIRFHAHMCRHTALRRATKRRGVEYAKELSGHVSDRHIWRYVQPSAEEKQEAQEEILR